MAQGDRDVDVRMYMDVGKGREQERRMSMDGQISALPSFILVV